MPKRSDDERKAPWTSVRKQKRSSVGPRLADGFAADATPLDKIPRRGGGGGGIGSRVTGGRGDGRSVAVGCGETRTGPPVPLARADSSVERESSGGDGAAQAMKAGTTTRPRIEELFMPREPTRATSASTSPERRRAPSSR